VKQAGGWITRCKCCGEWTIVRHRKEGYCVECQANKCNMTFKSFNKFYRLPAWRSLRKIIFAEKGRVCIYCGEEATHIDHQIPLSKGGTNQTDNLEPVCGVCNVKKQNKTDKEFRSYLI